MWEAILMRFPDGITPEDIPRDWQPPSIGTLAEVKSTLEQAFPYGKHDEGHSTVGDGDSLVEFSYGLMEGDDEGVRAITAHTNAGLDTVPVLRSASEKLGCRLLDLQAGQFADFSEQTEASVRAFVELRNRMNRERRWAFAVAVAVILILHALQDSGAIPAVGRLSKIATGVYGFLGLIAFLRSSSRLDVTMALPHEYQTRLS